MQTAKKVKCVSPHVPVVVIPDEFVTTVLPMSVLPALHAISIFLFPVLRTTRATLPSTLWPAVTLTVSLSPHVVSPAVTL